MHVLSCEVDVFLKTSTEILGSGLSWLTSLIQCLLLLKICEIFHGDFIIKFEDASRSLTNIASTCQKYLENRNDFVSSSEAAFVYSVRLFWAT
ncbi:hypothetical protein NPIL_27371 [Nephila pilipes]|uniref:Uncharacterized protein n=1 Tax=Nephila pilipes TaxID=299642 RepID=A0A8X6P5N9_NEPPI|nr:hypothetical protein NPIL_27371 [Nephila pilipes]